MPDLPQALQTKSLLVSILSLGRTQDVLQLLVNLPGWLAGFAHNSTFLVRLVVRNNDPNQSFAEVRLRLAQCESEYPTLQCTLVSGEPNVGFGRGHNENYRLFPAGYILILNDDIGFPHINWLAGAIALLERKPRTACVGAAESPQYLNPLFGSGHERPAFAVETLKYAEASVLLFNGKVFEQLGMFDERLQWAMCEDADLSLRAQQLGYRLHWMSMPHEHWRSSSVNSLPSAVRSSILEHNRATLFASWSQTLATGRIGRLEVFDLHSLGMGDVFCVLPHLRAWLAALPATRREQTVINTNHPELMDFLGVTGVRITNESEEQELLSALDVDGVTSLHSIRAINYSLPMNLHVLLCGALGLPMCDLTELGAFRDMLRNGIGGNTRRLPSRYCVVHLEFTRDHQGRGLAPSSVRSLLMLCSRLFETVVLVGNERRLAVGSKDVGQARVIDLQGKLPLRELIAIIAGAEHFVGIDSLPAHVAQAAGVRSAVFYGAVHPLARVWDEALVWPLVAELDCLGCYHTHLDSSAPFCMRRDEACTIGPANKVAEQVLRAMLTGARYDWSGQRRRFDALQAKWFGFLRHHPSLPERLMRPAANRNELVTHLVYRILDETAELAGNRYRTTTMNELTERLRELEAQLFAREVELDEMRQAMLPALASQTTLGRKARPPVRTTELADLPLLSHRCKVIATAQWLDVTGVEDDPQLHLPVICGNGGQVRLGLRSIANGADTMQVYWANGDDAFNEEWQRSISIGPEASSAELSFDLAEGDKLKLRIDPLLGAGRMRLYGAVSGTFDIDDPGPVKDAAPTRRNATEPKKGVRSRRQHRPVGAGRTGNGGHRAATTS